MEIFHKRRIVSLYYNELKINRYRDEEDGSS